MKHWNIALAALLAAASFGAAAHEGAKHKKPGAVVMEQKEWGIAGDARSARRTVELTMSDNMRFSPNHIEVRQGETVRFVVKNSGQVQHEFVIGTASALEEHAALMLKFPNMEHDEPYMAHVAAGRKGELVWTFNRAGNFDFACLIAGHYQAGMKGTINVRSKS
ncbi:MAG: cupredoxin family protein [Ramlibacter sp.]|nr:cupredoxin family protein [Ramlibacter sp.]